MPITASTIVSAMATITAAPSSSIPAAPPGDHVGDPGEGGGAPANQIKTPKAE